MKIKNTLLNDLFIEDKNEHFPSIVKQYLENYINMLEELNLNSECIKTVKDFANNVYISLIEYYKGQHESSKYFFNEALKKLNIIELNAELKEDIFYRGRKNTEKPFTKLEMFHIPFDERYKISTQRYSYPGLPCLYLGSTSDVCCLEIDNFSDIDIAMMEKNKDENIYVLDLCFFSNYNFENLEENKLIRFYTYWPLIACCSFNYEDKNNEMKFHPEYIIPQLLLEYIVDINSTNILEGKEYFIYGIKYFSVKYNFLLNNLNCDDYINYVFPTLSSKKSGLCDYLSNIFSIKEIDSKRSNSN